MSREDVSYSRGLLIGRMVGTDDSDGTIRFVPGVHFRWRLSEVLGYHQDEPGVLHVYVRGQKEAFALVGSVAAMDKVLARDSLTAVPQTPEAC